MPPTLIDDYLSKLIKLEKVVGSHTTYTILEPFAVNPDDPLDIQKAAKRIAEFVGLKDFVFIVGIAKQEKDIGGHIELQNRNKEVFIEISGDLVMFPEAVLATLAHELTHKYLYIHNLYSGIDVNLKNDDEILTDLAAVYLGLGKLMLNGCECERRWETNAFGGTQKNRQTLRSGYLSRVQFALAYNLVCEMRKIPENKYLSLLSIDAVRSVKDNKSTYGLYFQNNLHNIEKVDSLKRNFNSEIVPTNEMIFALEAKIDHIREILEATFDSTIKEAKNTLEKRRADLFKNADQEIYNPSLKYLTTVKCFSDFNLTLVQLDNLDDKLEIYLECLERAINAFQKYQNRIAQLPKPPEIKKIGKGVKNKSILSKLWSR